jgi:uncharacterized protein (DUF2336 family)
MIVRSYLDWSRKASADERALAVRILAEMHAGGELPPTEQRSAEAALLMAIEDPAIAVRKTLAEVLGASPTAPRALVLALTQDSVEIAGIVLANSPVLTEADVIASIRKGDPLRAYAVAMRAEVPLAVSAVLVREADAPVLRGLLKNDGAQILADDLAIVLERFPQDAALRELLTRQPDLSPHMRLRLARATAGALSQFAEGCGWMMKGRAERLQTETDEKLVLTLASGLAQQEFHLFVTGLLDRSELTPRLLFRAVLSGDTRLLAASIAQLGELPEAKVRSFVQSAHSAGFRAAYTKAALPEELRSGFEAALASLRASRQPMDGETLQLSLIEATLTAISGLDAEKNAALISMLSDFQVEAARAHANAEISSLMLEAPEGQLLEAELTLALERELNLAA